MNTINKLKPFGTFLATIGNLPTSYMESLTYEEQILWFCKYLNTEIAPHIDEQDTAINNLINWFNNLDISEELDEKIQTEINNLVESGYLYNLVKPYFDDVIQPQINAQNNNIETFKTTVNNNINNFESTVNSEISQIETMVQGATSGSPLVADSTEEMTDTSRIYVNTSDGNWYYYNSTTWVSGGTYQSTGIGENEVLFSMLEKPLQEYIVPESMKTIFEYTTQGSYIYGNVGSEISILQSPNYKGGSINVQAGDVLYNYFFPYDVVGTYVSNNIFPFILVDSNDVIVAKISASELCNTTTNEAKKFTYVIPTGVSKVYVNNYIAGNRPAFYPSLIGSYNYLDNRYTNSLNVKEEISESTHIDSIYSLLNWNIEIGTYRTRVYNVKAGEKVNVVTTLEANKQFVAGIYTTDDLEPIGYINVWGNNSTRTEVNTDSVVPAGATKLLVCALQATTTTVSKYQLSDVNASQYKKLTVVYNDGELSITNNENNTNIKFENYGGNNLFMIKSYTVAGTTKNVNTDMTPAPYIVNAINDIDGDRVNEGFTGGNHQWNNQASGSTPTAEQISLAIYCDDTQISESSSSLYCNEVKIVEINRVQANNTCLEAGGGRNVLEEKIVFNYDGYKLNILNTITPLEAINIKRYYGIQLAGYSSSAYKIYADKVYTASNHQTCNEKPERIYGGSLSGKLNESGLGNYELNNNSTHKVIISNDKAYFAPIYDNNINFNTSDIVYIEGDYIFKNNQN